ncbi:hypothetical protein LTR66_005876 [Elasticomyces elasticus]|nr:hypothetical protein LTR66_005876 [Elasticomyces elasticus]
MGRKQNPIVVRYFIRGEKLEDQSNRYQYTCGNCGEHFAKGRQDTLINHITQKCHAISFEERQQILLLANNLVTPRDSPSATGSRVRRRNDQGVVHAGTLSTSRRESSALDILADASRQLRDMSGSRDGRHTTNSYMDDATQSNAGAERRTSGPEWRTSFQQAPQNARTWRDSHGEASATAGNGGINGNRVQATSAPNVFAAYRDSILARSGPASASSLMQAASAANELHATMQEQEGEYVEEDYESLSSATVGASKPSQQRGYTIAPEPPLDPALQDDSVLDFIRARPGQQLGDLENSQYYTRSIAMAAHPNQAAQPVYPQARATVRVPRKRKNFDDSRRKEVQEIRKRGACIRCRMLKKPVSDGVRVILIRVGNLVQCSEGTPCKTCTKVETARLWKHACIRSRLAEELTMYSAGFFKTRAGRCVNQMLRDLMPQPDSGKIEVSLFPDRNMAAKFPAIRVTKRQQATALIDPDMTGSESQAEHPNLILNAEHAETDRELAKYITAVAKYVIEQEASPFVLPTLIHAIEMSKGYSVRRPASVTVLSQADLSSSFKDVGLQKASELWAATSTLIALHRNVLPLKVRYVPDKIQTVMPPSADATVGDVAGDHDTSRLIPPDSPPYAVIHAQLQAAIERRCDKLSKAVMNDLERRFVQRQHTSSFLAFLLAVLLFHCVERMAWLFRSLDTPENSAQAVKNLSRASASLLVVADGMDRSEPRTTQAQDGIDTTNKTQHDLEADEHLDIQTWPFTQSPSHYWKQGDSFSDLLHMLLRMRDLPPKTLLQRESNTLTVKPKALPVGVGGASDQASENLAARMRSEHTETEAARIWVESLRITYGTLIASQHTAFDEASPSNWDLKFVSKLLLPRG